MSRVAKTKDPPLAVISERDPVRGPERDMVRDPPLIIIPVRGIERDSSLTMINLTRGLTRNLARDMARDPPLTMITKSDPVRGPERDMKRDSPLTMIQARDTSRDLPMMMVYLIRDLARDLARITKARDPPLTIMIMIIIRIMMMIMIMINPTTMTSLARVW